MSLWGLRTLHYNTIHTVSVIQTIVGVVPKVRQTLKWTRQREVYYVECGIRNAEFQKRVIRGIIDAQRSAYYT